jgi:hypothetical protein
MADETPLSVPRYRGEERSPNLAAFTVEFADTPVQDQTLLSHRAAQLPRAGSRAELVVIDQESEAIVARREVGMPPDPESWFREPVSNLMARSGSLGER